MNENRSPSLAEVMRLATEKLERTLRVGLPGRIEKFDPVTQLADVKPLLKEVVFDEQGTEDTEDLPVITNVPVHFSGGGNFAETFPIAVGDSCWLGFADRSLDQWLSRGNDTDPIDLRRHELSDAVCWVGIRPNPAKLMEFDTVRAVFGNNGPRVACDGVAVHLGVAHNEVATQKIVRGDAYRVAEDTMLSALSTQIGIAAGLLTAAGPQLIAAAAANAIAPASAVVPFGTLAATLVAAGAALQSIVPAITQFTLPLNAVNYTTDKAKVP